MCLILAYFLTNDLLLKALYFAILGLAHFFLPRSVDHSKFPNVTSLLYMNTNNNVFNV